MQYKSEEYELLPVGENDHRSWMWIAGCCISSVFLYLGIFSQLKFPYSIGIYERMLNVKTTHFEQSPSPRLLIIAGSNARVSHNARVMQKELGIPVTNGGLSAAVSTAFLIESYQHYLKRGDICYLPLEYEPLLLYNRSHHADFKFTLAYERKRMKHYDFWENFQTLFACDLGDVFISFAERAAVDKLNTTSDREDIDELGDNAVYDDGKMKRFRNGLASMDTPVIPTLRSLNDNPEMVERLKEFLDWCSENGVLAIGGLPTVFEDVEIDPDLIAKFKSIYESKGHAFIVLENMSRYPRDRFYDSSYHLALDSAVEHSRMVVSAIKPLIDSHLKRSEE